MEFKTQKSSSIKATFKTIAILMFLALLIYSNTTEYINSTHEDIKYLTIGGIVLLTVGCILLIFATKVYEEKIIIEGDSLSFFRKDFRSFKEVDSLKITEISHLLFKVSNRGDADQNNVFDESAGFFCIVDIKGNERFAFSKELFSEDKKNFLDYASENLRLETKREIA